MLWGKAQWRLDVEVAHVTAAYAGVNIAGPASRDMLQPLVEDVDLSAEAFPYMGLREGHVAGIPARLIRVGGVPAARAMKVSTTLSASALSPPAARTFRQPVSASARSPA